MQIQIENLPRALPMRARTLAGGEQWLAGLQEQVERLARRWGIEPQKVLHGGTESLVLACTHEGKPAVLKLGLPSCDCPTEARVLRLARGQGYADLILLDEDENALLVEALGQRLSNSGLSVGRQIETLCATHAQAWQPLPPDHGLMTGEQKARSLAEFSQRIFQTLERPCTQTTLDLALRFAQERAAAHDPAASVLVHGDAHADNTLQAADGRYKFVDPDGLFAERALDLAIPMREWNEELLPDPVRLGLERCALLVSLTGLPARAIWQWGFMERVSTGLHLMELGLTQWGRQTLAIADFWSEAGIVDGERSK